eukprot:Opistho-2@59335
MLPGSRSALRMFTGIVRGLCPVHEVVDKEGGRRLRIRLPRELATNLETGASVAINGTCLTVVSFAATKDDSGVAVDFDVMQESLNRTNLGLLITCADGDLPSQINHVNVERSMRFGDEVGGHHVSGHVDCVGTISELVIFPNNREVVFKFDEEWSKFLVPKGWIAVDGISLTVVRVGADFFSVCLIPETLARTTLGIKGVGDAVNLEFDSVTKITVITMERHLPRMLDEYMARKQSQ